MLTRREVSVVCRIGGYVWGKISLSCGRAVPGPDLNRDRKPSGPGSRSGPETGEEEASLVDAVRGVLTRAEGGV